MIFDVDPGSKTSEKATLPSLAPFLPTSVLGSNVGYEATLSRFPVLTSMMTTVPEDALVSLIRWANEFWAYHCRLELTVRVTSLSVDGRDDGPFRDRDDGAVPALLEGLASGPAVEAVVHHQLDTSTGFPVGHDIAHERRARRALGVGALGARLAPVAVDARDLQLGDGVPRERRDVAAEDAVATRAGQVGHELGHRGAEQRRELGGRLLHRPRGGRRVAGVLAGAVGADGLLVGDDDLSHDARGEHGAVGREDPAAHGRDDLGRLAAHLGLLCHGLGVEPLDAHELGTEDAEDEQAGHGEEPHPAAGVARRHVRTGRSGGPPGAPRAAPWPRCGSRGPPAASP